MSAGDPWDPPTVIPQWVPVGPPTFPPREQLGELMSTGKLVVRLPAGTALGDPPDLIPATEVATMLGLNIKTVYMGAAAGEIPARRVGRRFLFSRTAITRWLACESTHDAAA